MRVMTFHENKKGVVHLLPLVVIAVFVGTLAFSANVIKEQETVLGRSEKGKSSDAPGRSDEKGNNIPIVVTEKEEKKGRKFSLEVSGDNLILEENGISTIVDDKIELEEGDELGIEEDDGEVIEVTLEDDDFVIESNGVKTRTNFPLSVDSSTNELIVSTPAGTRRVTVLPDVAIANMIRGGFIDVASTGGGEEPTPGPSETPTATGSASPTPTAPVTPTGSPPASPSPTAAGSEIVLGITEDGELVYEIEGTSLEKLFGMFIVNIEKKLIVSAETGEVIEIEQNLWNSILDALSV